MEPMLAEFSRVAEQVSYAPPRLGFISNVSGGLADDEVASARYWVDHVMLPVRFGQVMASLQQQACDAFLELGPKPTLLGMGRTCLPDSDALWLTSLRPGVSDWQSLLAALGELYVRGVAIDWQGFDRDGSPARVELPTYPFQRQRYWLELDTERRGGLSKRNNSQHAFQGRRVLSSVVKDEEQVFEFSVSEKHPAYLAEHRLYGNSVFPASAYIEIALSAGAEVFDSDGLSVTELALYEPLVLNDDDQSIQIVLTREAGNRFAFRISGLDAQALAAKKRSSEVWRELASGKLSQLDYQPQSPVLQQWQSQCGESVDLEAYYSAYARCGLDYGPDFRAIARLWRGDGEALGELRLSEELSLDGQAYQLHPVLLDAGFQLLGAALDAASVTQVYLPVGFERMQVWSRASGTLWGHVKRRDTGVADTLSADVQLLDSEGSVVACLEGLQLKAMSPELFAAMHAGGLDRDLYELQWQAKAGAPLEAAGEQAGCWLIFADRQGVGAGVAAELVARGEQCVLVYADEAAEVGVSAVETCVIDPQRSEAYREVLQASSAWRGVVHLWSLDHTQAAIAGEALSASRLLECASVLDVVQALVHTQALQPPRLWLVTRGAQAIGDEASLQNAQQSALWGLGRVVALEQPQYRCTRVDLDVDDGQAQQIGRLCDELIQAQAEDDQLGWRAGERYVARLVRAQQFGDAAQTANEDAHCVAISQPGDLDKLQLEPCIRYSPGPGEVEIAVHAVGLNFKDVLHALGLLALPKPSPDTVQRRNGVFGLECSGVVTALGDGVTDLALGDTVFAAGGGCLGSHFTVNADYVLHKPDALTFAQAAALPTAFLTAYYALYELAKLKSGDRVLIHAGAGGVGQAAIQLAQRLGAEVFATASAPKREHLKQQGVRHVMDSRSLDFAEQIMTITQGKGIDVVLNSLSGDYIPKNLEVLAANGRFVEIGKLGIWSKQQVAAVRPDIAYFSFDLSEMNESVSGRFKSTLSHITQWLKDGSLRPLPLKQFSIDNRVDAFRYLSGAKNIGKVVIDTVPEAAVSGGSENICDVAVNDRSTYLITGGLGGLGLEVAQWLAEQGARHLVLLSRRAPSEQAQTVLTQLADVGVEVAVESVDVTQQSALETLLQRTASTMPPLAGIVHAAGALDDGVLTQQTRQRFDTVMTPKVQGAWNLHQLTQDLALDFFVCFSSISAVLGSPGQGNYAAANAYMDALMHYRRGLGLPGTSINWGPWALRGMAAMKQASQVRMSGHGIKTLSGSVGLALLERLLAYRPAQMLAARIDWQALLKHYPAGSASFLEAFRGTDEGVGRESAFLMRLKRTPSAQRRTVLMEHIRAQLASVLGLTSEASIEPRQRLFDLGIDSLLAVELKNRLEVSLGCVIPNTLLFDYPTLEAVVDYLNGRVLSSEASHNDDSDVTSATTLQDDDEELRELEQLSDDDLEALLAKELGK